MSDLSTLPAFWPKLSETLLYRFQIDRCHCCDCKDDGDLGLSRWLEHDDCDGPTPVVILLCKPCADRIIEPHPRLYRRMQATEPFPRAMRFCKLCRFRDHLLCTNPLQKRLGGPGLPMRMSKPMVGFIDYKGGGHAFADYGLDHPKCDGFEVES